MLNRTEHYCKHCQTPFRVKLHEEETGDFLLECPTCGWRHYRHFENGVAVHCEFTQRRGEPIKLKGEA